MKRLSKVQVLVVLLFFALLMMRQAECRAVRSPASRNCEQDSAIVDQSNAGVIQIVVSSDRFNIVNIGLLRSYLGSILASGPSRRGPGH
ncbi:hypothetical protein BVRB_1g015520 [Beta vulgaris subsp. vulgaris]|nr:hypothetical protein BVRB_1g015520 [Beta vulgaris subsp. vulgaris]